MGLNQIIEAITNLKLDDEGVTARGQCRDAAVKVMRKAKSVDNGKRRIPSLSISTTRLRRSLCGKNRHTYNKHSC